MNKQKDVIIMANKRILSKWISHAKVGKWRIQYTCKNNTWIKYTQILFLLKIEFLLKKDEEDWPNLLKYLLTHQR